MNLIHLFFIFYRKEVNNISTITAPSPPIAPFYIGKGIRGANNAQLYIFGQSLPNNLSTSDLTAPLQILDATTLFDVSSLTINHEVVVALYVCPDDVYSAVNFTAEWYRDRDNYNIYTNSSNMPAPPSGQYYNPGISYPSWVGYCTEESFREELAENGNYHVVITASGGINFTQTINFAVKGISPSTLLSNPTTNSFDWEIRLSEYFDTDSYIRAGICTNNFTDGQSSEPLGILSYNNAPSSNNIPYTSGTATPVASNAGYLCYGFAQSSNGLYYKAGIDNIITLDGSPSTPSSAPIITSRIEGGFNLSWGSSTNATSYTLRYKNYDGIYYTIPNISGTTYALTGLEYGVTYYLSVKGNNSAGSSSYTIENPGTTTAKSPGNLTNPAKNNNTIDVRVADGMSGNWDYIRIYAYNNGITPTYKDITYANYQSGTRIVTWTGLTLGLQYRFNARTYYIYNSVALDSVYWSNDLYVTTTSRPSNFNWTTPKIQGNPVTNLTATEWNALCTRINEFRQYKGLSTISFTILSSGGFFYASSLNEARNAIYPMNSTGLFSTRLGISDVVDPNNADDLLASDLNALVNCLNNIV